MKIPVWRMTRSRWLQTAAAVAILGAGFVLGDQLGEANPPRSSFHDFRVNHPEEYSALVDPEAPGLEALAKRLGSLEGAYRFVRDEIAFDPSCAAAAPAEVLGLRQASCLGKAALLASLYRALGVPPESVRVVVGQVPYQDALLEYAWVDLEYGSLCLQQDATDLLGVHDFLRFTNNDYVKAFVHRELYCFNDRSFAAISQLNRLRGRHP